MSAGRGDLRLAVVGCGRIVERGYVPAALDLPGIRIAAFADPDAARVRRCLELWERGGGSAGVFGDCAELLASERIDALLVATPAPMHLPIAAAAAAAAVPTLVEKPPAADLEEAQRLAALEPGPLIAFNRRFLQGAELRQQIPASGWIELELELRYRRDAWAAHEARDDALLDAGVHLIDLAAFLARAAPICVRRALVEPERAEFEIDLARGRARVSCATDRRHRESVEVRDRAGRLLARSLLGGVRGRVAALRGEPHPLVLSIGRELAALRDAVQGGGPSTLASAGEGAAALAVVEAVRRSAQLDGAEVTVPLPIETHA